MPRLFVPIYVSDIIVYSCLAQTSKLQKDELNSDSNGLNFLQINLRFTQINTVVTRPFRLQPSLLII